MTEREILFRGKAINRENGIFRTNYKNGDWVYGLITRQYDKRFKNLPAEMRNTEGVTNIEVDYKSIGQFTGICDENGKKIFEGDICKSKDNKNYLIKIGSFIPLEFYSVFEFEEQFIIDKMAVYGAYATRKGKDFIIPEKNSLIILGNIHDNPELIKEREK